MKKILSILMCMIILLSFGACDWFSQGEDEIVIPTTSQRSTIVTKSEVESLVSQGKVEGAVFQLRSNIDEIKEHFFAKVSDWTITVTSSVVEVDGETKVITETSPYDNTQIVTAIGEREDMYKYQVGTSLTSVYYDGEQYFFVNGNESAGAAIVVCNVSAYGFTMGNCPEIDVETSLGKPDVADVPSYDQLFFCLGSPVNPTRYTYNFGDKRLDFIFSDGNLLVVTLTDTTIYNGFSQGEPITTAPETTGATTTTISQ